jgi:hypothetical protein
VHHEPPDETCGVLELDVGADLGDLRPAADEVLAGFVVMVEPGLAWWPAGVVVVVDGVVAADDVTPGSA